MSSSKQTPVWPFVIVLVVLFVLSVTAPRAWRSALQKPSPPVVEERFGPFEPAAAESAPSAPDTLPPPAPTFALELDAPESLATEPSASTVVAPERDVAAAQVPPSATPAAMELAPPFANQAAVQQVDESTSPPALELPPAVHVAHLPEIKSDRPAMTLPEATPGDPADDLNWQAPTALLAQLERLAQSPDCAAWAIHVRSLLLALAEDLDGQRGKAQRILPELRQAAQSGAKLASGITEPPTATLLMRTQYALIRRLDLWERTPGIGLPSDLPPASPVAVAPAAEAEMATCLASIESLTRSHEHGPSWREYLMLQDLKTATQANVDFAARQELARTVLARLQHARRTISDRRLLQRGPLASLDAELNRWAAEQVDPRRLLAHVERYEEQLDAQSAQHLADDWRALHWSSNEADQELAAQLDAHYRNANVRLAVAGTLVNRFVPQPDAISSPVRDFILGASVRGRSTTFTTLTVKLLPDPRQLRLGFEALGVVDSDTAATSGPATLYSVGQSSFWVRKLAVVNANGLRTKPAIASADNYYNNLVDVESDYDNWPFVGGFVRDKAREQHEELRNEARNEVSQRLAVRAREQFDSEMEPRIAKARGEFDRRVLKPLDKLALDLTPVDMATTSDRLVMRLRVAGGDQLAAHTPRPRALSDSLISLQLHESALNNILERLDLAGREFTIAELMAHVTQRLSLTPTKLPDDLPENVAITFADEGAVRLRCVEGRMQITLNVKELTQGRHRWHDFSVMAYYQPQIVAQSASLVRDGGIQLGGESIRGKPELLLRSIFSKALSKSRPWNIVDPKLAADPRLSDLEVTQFTVEDGWIGLSYSPRRMPSSVAKRPATTSTK